MPNVVREPCVVDHVARHAAMIGVVRRWAFRYGATVEEVIGQTQTDDVRAARGMAIRTLWSLGYTRKEIGALFDLTKSTISYRLSTAPGMTAKRGTPFYDRGEEQAVRLGGKRKASPSPTRMGIAAE